MIFANGSPIWEAGLPTGGERITVTRSGKPLFAVVPYEDAELLEALEERMDLDLARQALQRNDTVAWAKAKKELGL